MSSVLRAACISFSSLELTILPIELSYPANSIPDNLNYEKGEEPRIAKKSKTADAVAVYNNDKVVSYHCMISHHLFAYWQFHISIAGMHYRPFVIPG